MRRSWLIRGLLHGVAIGASLAWLADIFGFGAYGALGVSVASTSVLLWIGPPKEAA